MAQKLQLHGSVFLVHRAQSKFFVPHDLRPSSAKFFVVIVVNRFLRKDSSCSAFELGAMLAHLAFQLFERNVDGRIHIAGRFLRTQYQAIAYDRNFSDVPRLLDRELPAFRFRA